MSEPETVKDLLRRGLKETTSLNDDVINLAAERQANDLLKYFFIVASEYYVGNTVKNIIKEDKIEAS